MQSPLKSIIRQSIREPKSKLNILTTPTHENFESGLALSGHNFYAILGDGIKPGWNESYRKKPDNYNILSNIPSWLEFDLCLGQQVFGSIQLLQPIAQKLHLPLIRLEHTDRMDWWGESQFQQLNKLRGDINVFISKYSQKRWGFDDSDSLVINHGVNTDVFRPADKVIKQPFILNVANDFKNRGHLLGYDL